MPDHKESGREPTEHEREVAFEPHNSPSQQADGDPGEKDPAAGDAPNNPGSPAEENKKGETAGNRGQWD